MTGQGLWLHDRGMDLPAPLAWLVDEAGASPSPDRFLAELGGRLLADGLPLAGGALTLAVPHPIIARRTWLWRAETGAVIEALGFAGGPLNQAGRDWLAEAWPGAGGHGRPGAGQSVLGWAGTRPFGPAEAGRLRQAARFVAAPLAVLRGAPARTRGLSRPAQCRPGAGRRAAPRHRDHPRRAAAMPICATSPPCPGDGARGDDRRPRRLVRPRRRGGARLRRRGAEVHRGRRAGDFPGHRAPAEACEAALRAVVAARAGMAHLDAVRQAQGLPPLPFGAALHLGEILWGNIGAADRLDFTAIGPAVNLVSRLEGLCRPLGRSVLISGAVAAETTTRWCRWANTCCAASRRPAPSSPCRMRE